jgi:hypothetical protein
MVAAKIRTLRWSPQSDAFPKIASFALYSLRMSDAEWADAESAGDGRRSCRMRDGFPKKTGGKPPGIGRQRTGEVIQLLQEVPLADLLQKQRGAISI